MYIYKNYVCDFTVLQAQTGYPFIDAIMTKLRKEGWIHHLARHAVACFLTRGDLWISWEHGMKVKLKITCICIFLSPSINVPQKIAKKKISHY